MDMTNATAAGPNYGLLDLIFGSAPKEKGSAEQPSSADSIMALLAALEKQGKKTDEKGDVNWSDADNTSYMIANYGFTPIRDFSTSKSSANPEENLLVNANATPAVNINPVLLEAAGGNVNLALLMQKMQPSPEALRAIQGGDQSTILRMIEARKQELKEQLPALNILEKAIAREGLEKVVGAGAITKLVQELEIQYANQNRAQKGISTEDFLASKGIRTNKGSAAFIGDGSNANGADMSANFSGNAGLGSGGGLGAVAGTNFMANQEANWAREKFSGDALMEQGRKTDLANRRIMPDANIDTQAIGKNDSLVKSKGAELSNGEISTKIGESKQMGSGAEAIPIMASGEALRRETPIDSVDLNRTDSQSLRSELLPKVAHNINFVARQGGGQFNMVIYPRDMGEIQLKVSSIGSKVQVEVIADNKEVAHTLRSSTKELVDALRSQNLDVTNIDVSMKSSQNSSTNFSESNFSGNQSFAGSGFTNKDFQQAGTNLNDNRDNPTRDQHEQGPPRQFEQARDNASNDAREGANRNKRGLIDLKA